MKALILCPFHEQSLKDLSVMMPTLYESWTDTQKLYDPYDLANRVRRDKISIVIIEAINNSSPQPVSPSINKFIFSIKKRSG